MPQWPKDTMKAKVTFYGDPRGPHGVNAKWYAANVIRVSCPWQLYFADKEVKSIPIHKKCADALKSAFKEIWEACGKSQQTVEKHGLHEYGGTFAYRLIRGSASALSNHAFAIAIDLAPAKNPLGKSKGKMPTFAVDAFKHQGARWGGDYRGRKDPMHFEFVNSA
jgi:D-alanyl-D-alanine carboxypeptidase